MSLWFAVMGIFSLIWVYAFFSTLLSDFHNNTNKIVWIILLLFLAPSALLFPFIGAKQTINGTQEIAIRIVVIILFIILFIAFALFLGYGLEYSMIFSDKNFGTSFIQHRWISYLGIGIFLAVLPTVVEFVYKSARNIPISKVLKFVFISGISIFTIYITYQYALEKELGNKKELSPTSAHPYNN